MRKKNEIKRLALQGIAAGIDLAQHCANIQHEHEQGINVDDNVLPTLYPGFVTLRLRQTVIVMRRSLQMLKNARFAEHRAQALQDVRHGAKEVQACLRLQDYFDTEIHFKDITFPRMMPGVVVMQLDMCVEQILVNAEMFECGFITPTYAESWCSYDAPEHLRDEIMSVLKDAPTQLKIGYM